MQAKITSKGQLTLPKAIRERLGVGAGDEVEFVEENGRTVIRKKRPRKSPLDKWMGALKHLKGRTSDEVFRELRGR